MSLGAFGRELVPGPESWSWDSLDITLYNLAGQYRSQYGDKMLVNYESKNLRVTEDFLWRYRDRGILRHTKYPLPRFWKIS